MNSEKTKSKKEEKPILAKKRRCFSQSKLSKIPFGANNQSAIERLINSLDEPIKKSKIYKDADFKVEFGSEIDDANFEELFKKGINYAKMNFGENNLKVLKTVLLILKGVNGKNPDDEFGLKSCVNDRQKVYRKDLIFTLLSSKKKIVELGQTGQIESEFKKSIDYEIYIDNNAFNNALLYDINNKNELYHFDIFKDIINSPVILGVYREALDELYNVQITEKEIQNIIENFLKTHSIYFLHMSYKRYGMTLYNGTIVINKIYYRAVYNEEYAFTILWTLLHEIMHVLSRIKRTDNNFFLDTGEFTKNLKICSDESGNYFENKLLPNVHKKKCLTVIEAKYLLKKENYAYKTLKEFQNAFNIFRKGNKSKIQSSQSFAVGKESNDKTFSIKIGCYCAGERKND